MEQVGLSRALCRWIGKQAARIAYEASGRCQGDLEADPEAITDAGAFVLERTGAAVASPFILIAEGIQAGQGGAR